MPDPTDHRQRRHRTLIEGLIGPHEVLYTTNVQFHHQIRALADLLPFMIEGLAIASATSRHVAVEHLREEMMKPIAITAEQLERLGIPREPHTEKEDET